MPTKNQLKSRLKSWLIGAGQCVLLLALFAFAADWWRRPMMPEGAAAQPLRLLSGSPNGTAAERSVVLAQAGSGRTVLLYFWSSWCGVCRHTSPAVERLHREGVPVIGMAVRSGSDADVLAYLRGQGWDFASANDDDGTFARQWQMKVTPTFVLLREGRVVHTTTGVASYWGLKARLLLADWTGK